MTIPKMTITTMLASTIGKIVSVVMDSFVAIIANIINRLATVR